MSSWRSTNNNNLTHGGGVGGTGITTSGGAYGVTPQQYSYPNHSQQQPYSPANKNNNASANASIETNGPRAKCDQVVFEAIAKAAEVVVGSRCWIDPHSITSPNQQQMMYGNNINSPSTSTSSANSSRFNLLVPEVQGVRSILQRWKRALHVPLRLDVYYQHPDGQRELLERWCLEYAPRMSGNSVAMMSPGFGADPIVQLRQVCKNIVIWLRTLYCWSRLLPAQALRKTTHPQNTSSSTPPIGFSIYVVSEGQDDVSSLVSDQGFDSQGQPHCVPTPYGELGWKVFFAPKSVVLHLLEISTKTQPIPMMMQQQQHQQQQPYHSRHASMAARSAPQYGHRNLYRRSNSDVVAHHQPLPPQSALSQSPHSQQIQYRNNAENVAQPRSYHHQYLSSSPRHAYLMHAHKAQSSGDIIDSPGKEQIQQYSQPLQPSIENESIAERIKGSDQNQGKKVSISGVENNYGHKVPTKNLSGLSLALMMSDEQTASFNSTTSDGEAVSAAHDSVVAKTTTPEEMAAAEKRRAALHRAPPQFTTASPVGAAFSPLLKANSAVDTTAGEYGYAYNNHIPTLQQPHSYSPSTTGAVDPLTPVTPNTKNTSSAAIPFPSGTQQFPTSLSYTTTSPSLRPTTPLGSTPPGYLLSATPSTGFVTGSMTPSSMGSGGLIPPRSAVTPPFVRPMGFVGEPLNQTLPQPSPTPFKDDGVTATRIDLKEKADGIDHEAVALHHHQTSLDLLHSSPFQYPPSHSHFSSGSTFQQQQQLLGDFSSSAFLSDYYSHHRSGYLSSYDEFNNRGHSTSSHHHVDGYYDHDLSDDMPFAVDTAIPETGTNSNNASQSPAKNSSNAGASTMASMMNEASLVASMCTAAPKRLAMFDSKLSHGDIRSDANSSSENVTRQRQQQEDDLAIMVDSLADQLAEFKSFGASLATAGAHGSTNSFAPEAPTASAGSG